MKAWKIAAGVSCCLILATGCSTCQHPYYDCGPVWSQGACRNCNPDYRAGSIVNRHGPGVMAAENAPGTTPRAVRATEPAARATRPAQVAAHRSDGPEAKVRARAVAQERRTSSPAPAEHQSAQALPKRTVRPETSAPNHLPPGTVAAPEGTKEGATRILSVTDRRWDEVQKDPSPVALQHKSPQRTAEKPSEDFGGWRPVAPRQDPPETANRSRELDR